MRNVLLLVCAIALVLLAMLVMVEAFELASRFRDSALLMMWATVLAIYATTDDKDPRR